MEGTVKWFNTRKGYGFVKGDDDQEYFVHYSSLPQGTYLRENDRVSFDPAETERGKQAKNVTLLEGEGKEEGSEEAAEEQPEEGSSEEQKEE